MLDIKYIKDQITLSDVIGATVTLKRTGRSGRWIGKCPFHQDSTPSFQVDDNHGRWRCWGCGAGPGDVIDFIERTQGVDKKEALNQVKALAGVEDEFLTKSQRREYEARIVREIQDRKRVNQWREELRDLLICYTGAFWEIHRIAKMQLMDTWTEELDNQAESAYTEASIKERSLDELEEMSDQELRGWMQTRKVWEGVRNPQWFLSPKKQEISRAYKAGKI